MEAGHTEDLPHDPIISDKVMIALRKIIRTIDMNSKKLVKRVGLTGPQLIILREIAAKNDISPGAIANAVSLSQATVTGILERMEKRKLLTRKRSENDKRRIMVRLTDLGRQTVENAPPLMQESFVDRFAGLQEWEQTLILSVLQRLVVLMEAKTVDAGPFLETSSFEKYTEPTKGSIEP